MNDCCLADRAIDRMLGQNQTLFNLVSGLIDEVEQGAVQVPADIDVPSPPPSPALSQLEVPQRVRDWIADSKLPSTDHRALAHTAASQQNSSATTLKQQNHIASADTGNARNLTKFAKYSEAKVSKLVALYDGFKPCRTDGGTRTAPQAQGNRTACFDTFTPCRSVTKQDAASLDTSTSPSYRFSFGR